MRGLPWPSSALGCHRNLCKLWELSGWNLWKQLATKDEHKSTYLSSRCKLARVQGDVGSTAIAGVGSRSSGGSEEGEDGGL